MGIWNGHVTTHGISWPLHHRKRLSTPLYSSLPLEFFIPGLLLNVEKAQYEIFALPKKAYMRRSGGEEDCPMPKGNPAGSVPRLNGGMKWGMRRRKRSKCLLISENFCHVNLHWVCKRNKSTIVVPSENWTQASLSTNPMTCVSPFAWTVHVFVRNFFKKGLAHGLVLKVPYFWTSFYYIIHVFFL